MNKYHRVEIEKIFTSLYVSYNLLLNHPTIVKAQKNIMSTNNELTNFISYLNLIRPHTETELAISALITHMLVKMTPLKDYLMMYYPHLFLFLSCKHQYLENVFNVSKILHIMFINGKYKVCYKNDYFDNDCSFINISPFCLEPIIDNNI